MPKRFRTNELNIPWLTSIPERWRVAPSKRLFTIRKERALPGDQQLSATQAYGVIPQKEFERRAGRRVVHVLQHLDKRRHVERDDFVISMRSFQGGLERAWATGCIRSSYIVLEPSSEVDVGYFAHLFKSYEYIQALQATSNFIRDGQDLNFNNFCLVDLPVVPMSEQKAIARFLDHTDRRILRYIQAKQKLIRLLEEQKQVIIQGAVTRGLGNGPLKHTGAEWIGEIPEHWQMRRARYLFREVDSRSLDGSELHLSMSQKLGLVPSHLVKRTLTSESYAGGKLCRTNDLVLNRLKAHLGVFAVASQPGVISPDYTVLRAKCDLSVGYFERVLRSPACRRELRVRAKGIVEGFWRLYTDDFNEVYLPVPPVDEQREIEDWISKETRQLDTASKALHREIDLVKEYRASLKSNAVLGKLDVREAAAQLSTETSEDSVSDDVDVGDEFEDTEMQEAHA